MTDSFCKLGISIAVETAQTRIYTEHGDGYKVHRPDVCPAKMHGVCLRIYEHLLSLVKARDKMYIPPKMIRDPADPEAILAALRRFDMEHEQAESNRQSSNKKINRLFSSRG